MDSKGNFGKVYSRDMAWAASRYTEVRLDPICAELFRDIDQDAVDFVDNYDGKMKEPALLPTTFPNVDVYKRQILYRPRGPRSNVAVPSSKSGPSSNR